MTYVIHQHATRHSEMRGHPTSSTKRTNLGPRLAHLTISRTRACLTPGPGELEDLNTQSQVVRSGKAGVGSQRHRPH